jgi:hypothetical protein
VIPILLAAVIVTVPIKPNPELTPGAADPTATVEKICTPGYTATVRNVPESVKRQVFAEYHIDPTSDKFEVDHLISLELGGSNDIKNLWPQSYTTQPLNAHRKDVLENKLHRMICSKQITMKEAQKAIATDWVNAYNKYIGN